MEDFGVSDFQCPMCEKSIKANKQENKKHCPQCSNIKTEMTLQRLKRKNNSNKKFEQALADIGNTKQPAKKRYILQYKIIEEIGKGGMGRVYKVYDPHCRQMVALKMLEQLTEIDKQRFIREIKAIKCLEHPNIIEIYGADFHENQPFFTMDLIEGIALGKFLLKPSSISQRLEIIIKIIKAFAYMHNQGIIHRDLKPANVMLTKNLEPKVLDFGLSKFIEMTKELTADGCVLGTLEYMAPEQTLGKPTKDKRSDIYALGILLYQMITNRLPFGEIEDLSDLIRKINTENVIPPQFICPEIPEPLSRVCLKAMQKNKEDRYGNADELAQALLQIKQSYYA